MVTPNMIVRALRDEPILVYGDGEQSRCFSGVSDVVRGAILLSESRAAEGDVFNVGTAEEITIGALAERIKRLCSSSSAITFVPYEHVYGRSFEDMRRRVPDLTKIGRVVGYRPSVSLDQLLELTVPDTCDRRGIPGPARL